MNLLSTKFSLPPQLEDGINANLRAAAEFYAANPPEPQLVPASVESGMIISVKAVLNFHKVHLMTHIIFSPP